MIFSLIIFIIILIKIPVVYLQVSDKAPALNLLKFKCVGGLLEFDK